MKLGERYNLDSIGNTSQEIVYEAIERLVTEGTAMCTCEECVIDLRGLDAGPRHPPLLHLAPLAPEPRPGGGTQGPRRGGLRLASGLKRLKAHPPPRMKQGQMTARAGAERTHDAEHRAGRTATARPPRILVLEDEGDRAVARAGDAEDPRLRCDSRRVRADARRSWRTHYDIVLVDVHLPDGSGLELVGQRKRDAPLLIVMTGSNDIRTAVRAIRDGAIDFITKSPFRRAASCSASTARSRSGGPARALRVPAARWRGLVELKTEELSRTSPADRRGPRHHRGGPGRGAEPEGP